MSFQSHFKKLSDLCDAADKFKTRDLFRLDGVSDKDRTNKVIEELGLLRAELKEALSVIVAMLAEAQE